MIENTHSLTDKLFVENKYKIWRHLLLVAMIAFISINSVMSVYGKSFSVIGNMIYILGATAIVMNTTIVYLNRYVLTTRFLLREKYIQYFGLICLSISMCILLDLTIEYFTHKIYHIPFNNDSAWYSGRQFMIELISIFLTYCMFLTGISTIILFRDWQKKEHEIRTIETKNLYSLVKTTKEQISPAFLSRMLKEMAKTAASQPADTSDTLIKLSKILRFQLYDCTREKVLVKSEIEFLNYYLTLEKKYNTGFNFTIHQNKGMDHGFISPLQILPFIQERLSLVRKENKEFSLTLEFLRQDAYLLFKCHDNQQPAYTETLTIPFIEG